MIKNKYAAFTLFTALCIVFCNVLDFLYATFIMQSAYRFTATDDLLIPLAVAITVGLVLFFRKPGKKES